MLASLQNPFVIILLVIMILLGIVITLLASALPGRAGVRKNGAGEGKEAADPAGPAGMSKTKLGSAAGIAGAAAGTGLFLPAAGGVSDTVFYISVGVIVLELLVILALWYNLWIISAVGGKAEPRMDGRFAFVPAPRWWRFYGVFGLLLIAVACLWGYRVLSTPRVVDERTVKALTSPKDLAAGRTVFQGTCFVCHGKNGEGGIGPNLTDGYWIHGGSIQDIFRTIKYGWPDKGMKSWKDDYSPEQIAQTASYVKSLSGTHPANPKPPQGNLYKP